MSRPDDDEGVLSRWSRLKRTKPVAPEEQPEPGDVAATEALPETEEDEAALLERLNLPVPETLEPGDDFSRFMGAHVPAFLRQRALRVLWRSNPDLAALDGLVDYGEDFRASGIKTVVETVYQVGRGILTEKPAPDTEAEESKPGEDPPAPAAAAEAAPGEPAVEKSEIPDHSDQALTETPADIDRNADAAPPRPRRMVFADDD